VFHQKVPGFDPFFFVPAIYLRIKKYNKRKEMEKKLEDSKQFSVLNFSNFHIELFMNFLQSLNK